MASPTFTLKQAYDGVVGGVRYILKRGHELADEELAKLIELDQPGTVAPVAPTPDVAPIAAAPEPETPPIAVAPAPVTTSSTGNPTITLSPTTATTTTAAPVPPKAV